MSAEVAKGGDRVVGIDTHVVLVREEGGKPTPFQFPFSGTIDDGLSDTVFVDDAPLATVGSIAHNRPPHLPMGGAFETPPSNRATIAEGSGTVFAESGAVARTNDAASCCNDPVDAETGHVLARGTVYAG
ncbi:MAG: PAAR domain-containing protein [Polyangiaceae bacterium]|nr:PAAR domain-containing protein [Polyangiaceae bacterium]